MEALYRRGRETGNLNLCNRCEDQPTKASSRRSLDELPKEVLNWLNLVYDKQDWWLLEPLKQLNLSQNEISSIEATEEQLQMIAHQLLRCNLAHNALTSIPSTVRLKFLLD
jgi:hypothetical protein